jgi:hypothetical protein
MNMPAVGSPAGKAMMVGMGKMRKKMTGAG